MKTIVGFIAVVFSVLLFVPTGGGVTERELDMHIDLAPIEIHYIPSSEVLQSKWELEECKRKIEANLTYLNSTNESNTK